MSTEERELTRSIRRKITLSVAKSGSAATHHTSRTFFGHPGTDPASTRLSLFQHLLLHAYIFEIRCHIYSTHSSYKPGCQSQAQRLASAVHSRDQEHAHDPKCHSSKLNYHG